MSTAITEVESILATLQERRAVAEKERAELEAIRNVLGDKVESMIKKAIPRPSMTAEQIDDEIRECEHQVAHTASTRRDEEQMLRKVKTLRAQKASIGEYTAWQEELTKVKEQRTAANTALSEVTTMCRELRAGIKRLEVLLRVRRAAEAAGSKEPVTLEHLITETIEVSSEVLPRLIGKKGAHLKDLENAAGVGIDVVDDEKPEKPAEKPAAPGKKGAAPAPAPAAAAPVRVRVTGAADGIAKAKAMIADLASAIEEVVPLSKGLASFMVSRAAAATKALEDDHGVAVRVDRAAGTASIRGPAAAVAGAKAALVAHEARKVVIPVDIRTLPGVIGKEGANLKALRDVTTDADVDVVRNGEGDAAEGFFYVYGATTSAISAVAARLRLLIEQTEEKDVFESIPRDAVPWLLAKAGERAHAFTKATNVRLSVDKETADSASVKLRGTSAALAAGMPAFRALMAEYAACNRTLIVASSQARALIGPKGTGIAALRGESKAEVHVHELPGAAGAEKPTRGGAGGPGPRINLAEALKVKPGQAVVIVRGGSPAETEAAYAVVKRAVSGLAEDTFTVSSAVVDALVTNKGEVIQRIQNESGALIDVRKATVEGASPSLVVCGARDAVAAARAAIRAIEDTHQEEVVTLPSAAPIPDIVGTKGAAIKALKEAHPGLVDLDVNKEALTVTLTGSASAIASAAAALRDMLSKFDSLNDSVVLDAALIPGLVGRKGASLESLQKETATEIRRSDGPGAGQVTLRIRGETAEGVAAAKAAIRARCRLDDDGVEVEVAPEVMGAVIGRSGARLAAIQTIFDVGMGAASKGSRISIRGAAHSVRLVVALIRLFASQADDASRQLPVDPSRIGAILGRKGARLRSIEAATGAEVGLPEKKEGAPAGPVTVKVGGSGAAVRKAGHIVGAIAAGSVVVMLERPSALLTHPEVAPRLAQLEATYPGVRLVSFAAETGLSAADARDQLEAVARIRSAATPKAARAELGNRLAPSSAATGLGLLVMDGPASALPPATVAALTAAVDRVLEFHVKSGGSAGGYATVPLSLAAGRALSDEEGNNAALTTALGLEAGAVSTAEFGWEVSPLSSSVALWAASPARLTTAVAGVKAAAETASAGVAEVPVSASWVLAALGTKTGAAELKAAVADLPGGKDAKLAVADVADEVGGAGSAGGRPAPGAASAAVLASFAAAPASAFVPGAVVVSGVADAEQRAAIVAAVTEHVASVASRRVLLRVPSSAFGAIIGKGGATISAIQSETGASIDLASRLSGLVAITAPSIAARDAAVTAIKNVIDAAPEVLSPTEAAAAVAEMGAADAARVTRTITGVPAAVFTKLTARGGGEGGAPLVRTLEAELGAGGSLQLDRASGEVRLVAASASAASYVSGEIETLIHGAGGVSGGSSSGPVVTGSLGPASASPALPSRGGAPAPSGAAAVPGSAAWAAAAARRPAAAAEAAAKPAPAKKAAAPTAAEAAAPAAAPAAPAPKLTVVEAAPASSKATVIVRPLADLAAAAAAAAAKAAAAAAAAKPAPAPVAAAPAPAPAPAPAKAAKAAPAPVAAPAPAPVPVVAAPAPAPLASLSGSDLLASVLGASASRLSMIGTWSASLATTATPVAAPALAPAPAPVAAPLAPPPGMSGMSASTAAQLAALGLSLPSTLFPGSTPASAALAPTPAPVSRPPPGLGPLPAGVRPAMAAAAPAAAAAAAKPAWTSATRTSALLFAAPAAGGAASGAGASAFDMLGLSKQ